MLHQIALVLVAFTFSVALGQLLFELLQLLIPSGAGPDSRVIGGLALPCLAFAAMSFSIVVTRRLLKWFIVTGTTLALLLHSFLGVGFWQASMAGLALAMPFLHRFDVEFQTFSRARFVHHLHNLQQLAILCGMGLSLWHETLRLPVLLSIFAGMAQWNHHLVGACPFTVLEARLTADREKAGLLEEQGYFLYYLRHWTGWPITRRQLTAFITVLITSMLGQWVLG